MTSLREVREFLSKYHQGVVPTTTGSTSSGGNNSPSEIYKRQRQRTGIADEHLIPFHQYEIRADGPTNELDEKEALFRIEDAIGTVERAWDELVEEHGLDWFSEYVPFHQNESESGIYIRQQGLRLFGHLLYHWSRVGAAADSPVEQVEKLEGHKLQDANWLLFRPPAFESVGDAIELAQEITIRYQWFKHQIELLSAYLEDATGHLCYEEYYDSSVIDRGPDPSLPERLAVGSVFRSSACATLSPDTVTSRVMIYRAVHPRFDSYQKIREDSSTRFKMHSRRLATELSSIATGEDERYVYGGIGELLPFERDPYGATPHPVPIYITRNEFDPDNGVYGNGLPLDEDWEIDPSLQWEKSYEKADNTLKMRADNAISKLQNNVRHGGFKWKPCTPDNRFYFRLNKQFRGIAEIDNRQQKVTLLDFGKHSTPADFGCYS